MGKIYKHIDYATILTLIWKLSIQQNPEIYEKLSLQEHYVYQEYGLQINGRGVVYKTPKPQQLTYCTWVSVYPFAY